MNLQLNALEMENQYLLTVEQYLKSELTIECIGNGIPTLADSRTVSKE